MDALDTAKIKETAWEKLGGKWSQAAVAILVFLLISIVIDIPSTFFEKDSTGKSVWNIIETPFALGLDIGLYAYFLNLARNKEIPLKRLIVGFTSGWGFYFNLICTQILALLFICLWALLFIIPGVMKAFSYSLVYFIILDHPEYSHLEILRKSSDMMYGHPLDSLGNCNLWHRVPVGLPIHYNRFLRILSAIESQVRRLSGSCNERIIESKFCFLFLRHAQELHF